MAKLTLADLANLNNQTAAVATINANSDLIETALENTLSRDGTSPNSMAADLDMNSNQILNLPAATLSTEPVRKAELDAAVGTLELSIASVVAAGVGLDTVNNTYLSDMTQSTIKGRAAGAGTGDPQDLTPTQTKTVLGYPTSTTDNTLPRFDGTTGNIQTSSIVVDDTNNVLLPASAALNWGSGDVTVTHSTDTLALAGAATGYTFAGGPVTPATNDGAALGTSSLGWADLFLASGAVLNFNNGDVNVTHSANALGFTGAASGYSFDNNVSVSTGFVELNEIASPSNPVANGLRLFAKDVASITKLYLRDSAGTETEVGAGGGLTVNIQSFTGSGTYTPTAGLDYCIVISTGAGGGGGGVDSDGGSNGAGGGGGAGATCIEFFSAATIGASQTVTIGAGGTAGAVTGTTGGTGGDTTFGALHTAGGGLGGVGIAATVAASQTLGGVGGTASGGTVNIPGGPGSPGASGTTFVNSGKGGASFWGGGAAGLVGPTTALSTAGNTATVPGAGASGAINVDTVAGTLGGVGAPGICVVIEFI